MLFMHGRVGVAGSTVWHCPCFCRRLLAFDARSALFEFHGDFMSFVIKQSHTHTNTRTHMHTHRCCCCCPNLRINMPTCGAFAQAWRLLMLMKHAGPSNMNATHKVDLNLAQVAAAAT